MQTGLITAICAIIDLVAFLSTVIPLPQFKKMTTPSHDLSAVWITSNFQPSAFKVIYQLVDVKFEFEGGMEVRHDNSQIRGFQSRGPQFGYSRHGAWSTSLGGSFPAGYSNSALSTSMSRSRPSRFSLTLNLMRWLMSRRCQQRKCMLYQQKRNRSVRRERVSPLVFLLGPKHNSPHEEFHSA